MPLLEATLRSSSNSMTAQPDCNRRTRGGTTVATSLGGTPSDLLSVRSSWRQSSTEELETHEAPAPKPKLCGKAQGWSGCTSQRTYDVHTPISHSPEALVSDRSAQPRRVQLSAQTHSSNRVGIVLLQKEALLLKALVQGRERGLHFVKARTGHSDVVDIHGDDRPYQFRRLDASRVVLPDR